MAGIIAICIFMFELFVRFVNGSTCPVQFEVLQDTTLLHDYCTKWILPLDRVPPHLKRDVCFSRCLLYDTCYYYMFVQEFERCGICVRDINLIDVVSAGSEFSPFLQTPNANHISHVRSEILESINNGNLLTFDCSTPDFGSVFSSVDTLEIPHDLHITSLQVCVRSMGSTFYGFNVIATGGFNETVGCAVDPVWNDDRMDFAADEIITSITITAGTTQIKGMRIVTNVMDYGFFGVGSQGLASSFTVTGRDLQKIEVTTPGSRVNIKSIKYQFKDCD